MRIRITLVAALIGAGVLSATLLPRPLARVADGEPIVPMGAPAYAARALEQNTKGMILEIRLTDEAGAPAFEAAIANGDAVVYMRSVVKAVVPLGRAIVKAESRAHARAIDAGVPKPLGGAYAMLVYFVERAEAKSRGQFAAHVMTGAFIANPDELYELHTPVDLARRLAL